MLKTVAADIWVVDGPEISFGFCGIHFPFPTRMTVVRLPDNSLWIHSPIKPEKALIESMSAIGRVRFLIAPNTLHYSWICDWATLFPNANVHVAPGLEGLTGASVACPRVLSQTPPPGWAGVIDQELLMGYALTEIDFFHRPSQTLIVTDLIENFETRRVGSWFYRLLLHIGGDVDPDGKAPIDLRLTFLRRERALRRAVERMISWEPERVIVSHGRWYEREGTKELRRAFRWVL